MGRRRKARRAPRPRKRQPRKKPVEEPEPRRSRFYTYGPLAGGPLLGGAAVAGVVYHRQGQRIQELQRKVELKEMKYREELGRKAVTVGFTILKDNPGLKDMLIENKMKDFSREKKLEIGIDALNKNPDMMSDFLADLMKGYTEITRLNTEIEVMREERPAKTLNAFLYGSGVLYAIVLFAVAFKRLRTLSRAAKAAAKKALGRLKSENPEPADEKRQETGPEDKRALPRTLELIAPASLSMPMENGTAKKKKKMSPIQSKGGNIFSADTCKALKENGIDPDETEKALIKAFRILASTIIIGERHAELRQVKKRLHMVFRDNKKVSDFLNFLQIEGMLRFHNEGKCVSLEPNPSRGIGVKMMSDILKKQQEMQRASGREFSPII